jgi:ABC-type multidrug transport system fused ATPase/permease subunit
MHLEPRLWVFTKGVRLRIAWTVVVGLASVACGISRLAFLAWLIGAVFTGRPVAALALPIATIAGLMVLRGGLEYARTMIAHRTAARVQVSLRRTVYDRIAALGPAGVGRRRSGVLSLALTDGIEQLETYFGQFLPQFLIVVLTPWVIFAAIVWIDLPIALTMLSFALIALFAPAVWHRLDSRNSQTLRSVYSRYAAEFLDSVQGMATLKAFGQSGVRGDRLQADARSLQRWTMRVLATNVMARGITDSAIACGAAAALALGAWRTTHGALGLPGLLVILMLGVEVFRPMRELRSVLHQGMVGLSAAKGLYAILDDQPPVVDAPAAILPTPLTPSIAFESVRFTYPETRRAIHDGLTFRIAPGERVGVVGMSGGGKSSIVRLLLRFYDPDAGTARIGGYDLRTLSFAQVRSMVSVVNQDTFLFHGTVADNISMGRPGASSDDVQAAAAAANIHEFVLSLPNGYATIIGEKGIRLSGGQRQRVAIARALLRDTPILVLDEALSAVDAENEAVIQEALDRLMRGRSSLILAHRLSSVISCDRILLLDGGKIAEAGSHAALMRQGGLYATLMAEQARESKGFADPPRSTARTHSAAATALPMGVLGTAEPGGPTEGVISAHGLGWGQLIVLLMRLVLPWKGRLAATFLLGVGRVVAFIGVGVLSALVILDLKHGSQVAGPLWALAILAPASGLLHWLESWMAHDMAFRLLTEMRIDVFRKLDALSPAYLVRRRSGDLMSLATHDIELVEYFFAHTVAPSFVAVLVPASVLAVLAWASPWLALALVPFLAAVALSPFLRRGRVDRLGSQTREAAGELGAFAVDTVQGIGEIVTYQLERTRGDLLDALSAKHVRLRLPFFAELTRQQVMVEVFTGLGGLAVVTMGAFLAVGGRIDAGLLPLLTILAMAAFLPISEIAQVGRQLADTLGATRRIYGLMNEPVSVRDGHGIAPGIEKTQGAASIVLESVSFTYPGQASPALSNVNVTIRPGWTVALVGPSGAGKTTLAQLLMRFWDPDNGRIAINDADLRDWQLDNLRRHIALVAQDTYLFNDTLENNIRMARPDASEADVHQAVRNASLDALVAGLPDGLGTQVGERGTSLSGGQRQRVAIARAFLKNAPVLILDEATSHLDALSERAVRDALARLQAGRTTIVIAHRLSTIRDANLIVVLDRGRVAETGTHPTLLSQGGIYAQLVAHQLTATVPTAAE